MQGSAHHQERRQHEHQALGDSRGARLNSLYRFGCECSDEPHDAECDPCCVVIAGKMLREHGSCGLAEMFAVRPAKYQREAAEAQTSVCGFSMGAPVMQREEG